MSFQELTDELNASLTYRMSLGSKELFHSNVWAWLIENDSTFAKCLFPNLDLGKNYSVRREEGNRDITFGTMVRLMSLRTS